MRGPDAGVRFLSQVNVFEREHLPIMRVGAETIPCGTLFKLTYRFIL